MKLLLVMSFTLLASFSSQAHEYFFGFAELSFNSTEQIIEGTLIISTHDVEEWFQNKELPVKELEDHVSDEKLIQQMATTLFSEFKITNNGTNIKLNMIGYEVLANGMTNFYFHSNKTKKPNKLDITFSLMINELPKQQNKITYLENEKSYTAVFTNVKKQSSIIIE
jgi:hypothetical protein